MKPGIKRVIKRKLVGGAAPKDFYFNANTQQAIVEYKTEVDTKKKEQLYITEIMPAFNKLVENLINVYGFQIQYETKADLQAECIEFLYGVITKFDPTKGTKAFSYFNVVAKNWLIIKSKQSNRSVHCFMSLDDQENMSSHDMETIENHNVSISPEEGMVATVNEGRLQEILAHVTQLASVTENEAVCMKAVNTLFENIEELDFLNKRASMIYLRTITGLSPKQLSIVLSSIKRHYKTAKDEYELKA